MQYKHYEGGRFRLVCWAADFATGEPVVVYQCEETGEVWVRPRDSFESMILQNGTPVERFQRIDSTAAKEVKQSDAKAKGSNSPGRKSKA